MNTSISHPEALAHLAALRTSLAPERVLTLGEDYRPFVRQPACFRSSNVCVTENRIVVEVYPGISGLEEHAIGVDHLGQVYVGINDASVEFARPLLAVDRDAGLLIALSREQRVAISHILELLSLRLRLLRLGQQD